MDNCNILAEVRRSKEGTHKKGSYDIKSHGTPEEKKYARTYGSGRRWCEVEGSQKERSKITRSVLAWLGFWILVKCDRSLEASE